MDFAKYFQTVAECKLLHERGESDPEIKDECKMCGVNAFTNELKFKGNYQEGTLELMTICTKCLEENMIKLTEEGWESDTESEEEESEEEEEDDTKKIIIKLEDKLHSIHWTHKIDMIEKDNEIKKLKEIIKGLEKILD